MSLWMYAKISQKSFESKLVETMLKNFFPNAKALVGNVDKSAVRTVIGYQDVSSDLDEVLFIAEQKRPFNIYESNLYGGDFQYEQEFVFCLDKSKITVEVTRMVVNFCIYMRGYIECDILVTSDMHDEICLLKEQTIIWNEDVMHLSPWK